jgi:hypothetical protein
MAKAKYDGVVEAVHYKPNGEVDWVRAYERRGPTFSDHVLLNRQTLIDRLKSGKKYMAGTRKELMASTFEVTMPLQVVTHAGSEFLSTGSSSAGQDRLEGIPIL